MTAEPITLYSGTIDPLGVLDLLRSLEPDVEVTGAEESWERIRITREDGALTLIHHPESYRGPEWGRRLIGMEGYYARFPDSPRKDEVLRLIRTFRFVLATEWTPELGADGDERLSYLFAVAEHLDGVIFTPSALRDAAGSIILDIDGGGEEGAVLPSLPVDPEDADEDEARDPPGAERVMQRALALAAVSARGLLEQHDPADPATEGHYQRLREWIDAVGLGDELEPDEWAVLQRSVGTLLRQDAMNAAWRIEGLVVLAWALGLVDMPPYDELVEVWSLFRAVCFLDAQGARDLQTTARLRSAEELGDMHTRLLALHWRLRDFTVHPEAMAFADFARSAWFGPFDVSAFHLIEGDLGLRGHAISKAPREVFGPIHSAARERHQASNWLRGYSRVYSRTDTST